MNHQQSFYVPKKEKELSIFFAFPIALIMMIMIMKKIFSRNGKLTKLAVLIIREVKKRRKFENKKKFTHSSARKKESCDIMKSLRLKLSECRTINIYSECAQQSREKVKIMKKHISFFLYKNV